MTIKSNLNSDFGYYNIIINNTSNNDEEAIFNETRTTPILSNCQDYYLACVRFKIPTSRIPLFNFELDSNGISPYQVSFSIGNNYLSLVLDNLVYDITNGDTTKTEGSQTRAIYYYNTFVDFLNKSIARLWESLDTNPDYAFFTNSANTGYNKDIPPYFSYTASTTLFGFNIPQDENSANGNVFTATNPDERMNIHFSNKLNYFFNGFNSKLVPSLNQAEQVLQFLYPTNNNGSQIYTASKYNNTIPEQTYIEILQNYSTINLWQTLTRILLATNIPVEQEYLGIQGLDGKNFNQIILTDFEIEPNLNGNQRDYIYYNADFPRYQNFTKNGDISFFDLRILYQNKSLNTFPLLIAPNEEVTVKLQFKRRKARDQLQYSSANEIKLNRRGRLTGFQNYN